MAEPLKHLIGHHTARDTADAVARAFAPFERAAFLEDILPVIDTLELMQRGKLIATALHRHLPPDFEATVPILHACLARVDRPGLTGWALLSINQFIAECGVAHLDLSLDLLKALTPHFTAEFGIRTFIHAQQDRALAIIGPWVADPNHHVRRLASEGTRPRLPWAMRLPALVRDPQPILPILEALMDDPEDYVRRSVANSLNDIAKDHPDLVAAFVRDAISNASPQRRQLLRHASRTLLKKGHGEALANFGFAPAAGVNAAVSIETPGVTFGEHLGFSLTVSNTGSETQRLMLDYAIHHRKANGSLAPKVFKWTSLDLKPGETQTFMRRHALRPITTRQYYAGLHRVEILVNGAGLASGDFELVMS
ncbi:DNA alkylation repair protein [Pararhizobium antarcticum]|uniref:DNA alkylation repair protein n=1 Tax=Pararhizobium antarcticum TaxID=1798805 RepID=A0A657LWP8_9HYPH|nr:DNA alkylation repair protein [Pararhizobium antarcticum]OJF95543.1 DNA alkylation repair protein [Rhizobium sp. 58]OJF96892.1 DNA alkylation repair protein [Pararhizobium antarcticum]